MRDKVRHSEWSELVRVIEESRREQRYALRLAEDKVIATVHKKKQMAEEKKFYVYILTSFYNKVIYIGVTSNLIKRVEEHKSKTDDCFTKKYNVTKLVYYEILSTAEAAIEREKQLKRWSRKKKTDLITLHNPEWEELEIY